MSDAAKLAKLSLEGKPEGTPYNFFIPTSQHLTDIEACRHESIREAAFAASVSFSESMSGLPLGSISWSIVRLYYSCFYCMRAMLMIRKIVPFNCGTEYLLDMNEGRFLKGGNSSHKWNWASLNRIASLKGDWYISEDSKNAYERLREHRDSVNYTHGFTDPNLHKCLVSDEKNIQRRFRAYRDDAIFLYTYLDDHLALAYPIKMIFELEKEMKKMSISLTIDNISHLKKVWKYRDRCPLT